MSRATLLVALLLAGIIIGCSDGSSPEERGGRVVATVLRPVSDTFGDTARFEAVLVAHACAPPATGVLLDAVSGGSGILLWVRPGDSSLPGEYPYAAAGDSGAPRSAIATLRFIIKDVARGVLLDSGLLEISRRGGRLSGRLHGAGNAVPGGMRVSAEARFGDVPPAADTVSCEVER